MEKLLFCSLCPTYTSSASELIEDFKVKDVDCFLESDKIAIMAAIETFQGGTDGFDDCIRELGRKILKRVM